MNITLVNWNCGGGVLTKKPTKLDYAINELHADIIVIEEVSKLDADKIAREYGSDKVFWMGPVKYASDENGKYAGYAKGLLFVGVNSDYTYEQMYKPGAGFKYNSTEDEGYLKFFLPVQVSHNGKKILNILGYWSWNSYMEKDKITEPEGTGYNVHYSYTSSMFAAIMNKNHKNQPIENNALITMLDSEIPTILCGDFNVVSKISTLRLIEDLERKGLTFIGLNGNYGADAAINHYAWTLEHKTKKTTFESDMIFASKNITSNAKLEINNTNLSDHRALVFDFEI